MNLLHLRYFVELAATEHYTRAAERLCITQPSLSHAMGQLEAELVQIARPSWEREFYLIHDASAYQSPVAHSFREFVLDGVCM